MGNHCGAAGNAADGGELLGKTRGVPASSASKDRVLKVVGRVKATSDDRLLEAPLSAKRCVYYEVVVEVQDDAAWAPLGREAAAVDAFLADGAGAAYVRTSEGVLGFAPTSVVVDISARAGLDARAASFCHRNRIERFGTIIAPSGKPLLLERTNLRAREVVVEPGDAMAVLGYVRDDHVVPVIHVSPDDAKALRWTATDRKLFAKLSKKAPGLMLATTLPDYVGVDARDADDHDLLVPPAANPRQRWLLSTFDDDDDHYHHP